MSLSTDLCLACASSLPPRTSTPTFLTPCCRKPICSSCITSNSRLARYNPCLACLGGVEVVSPRLKVEKSPNVDGAVRDSDNYVIGDDEDDEDLPTLSHSAAEPTPQPAEQADSAVTPPRYFVKRSDTLRGIALRFSVSERELCVLNKLPFSTLNTTPHLLYTRTSLIMPDSAQSKLQNSGQSDVNTIAAKVSRTRERAEKRLQTLTKEVDWRIAKAYVALADDPEELGAVAAKRKEGGIPAGNLSLDEVAVEQYLDDEEWEAEQRRLGSDMRPKPFPFPFSAVQHKERVA